MPEVSRLSVLSTAWRAWVVDAELVWVEQHRVVVRNIELLLVTEQLLPSLRDCGDQSLSDLTCQRLVLLFCLVHLLLCQTIDLCDRSLVVVLWRSVSFSIDQSTRSKLTCNAVKSASLCSIASFASLTNVLYRLPAMAQ